MTMKIRRLERTSVHGFITATLTFAENSHPLFGNVTIADYSGTIHPACGNANR